MSTHAASAPSGGAMPDALHPRHLLVRVAEIAAVIALVVIAIGALPGLDEVRGRLQGADPVWVLALALAEVGSCVGYLLVFRSTFCSEVAFFVVTSAANFFALVLVVLAVFVGILAGSGSALLTLVPALITAVGVLLVGVSPQLLRALERRMAFDIAALGAGFAAVGTVPAFSTLVLGYLIGQLGNLIPLPGGVGGTEGALIGIFVLYGVNLTQATAAVLIYRLFQLLIPALLGAPAFVLLRRRLMSADQPALMCGPLALDTYKLPARGR